MATEIIEEDDEEEGFFIIKTEAQKDKIRQIIEYQKSLYFASSSLSSCSSTAASCSSFATLIKPILLWGSDTDDGAYDDPWMAITRTEPSNACRSPMGSASRGSFMDGESAYQNRKQKMRKRKLSRTKTFRRLPRFTQWRCRGFRFRLRFRRVRIMICGRIF